MSYHVPLSGRRCLAPVVSDHESFTAFSEASVLRSSVLTAKFDSGLTFTFLSPFEGDVLSSSALVTVDARFAARLLVLSSCLAMLDFPTTLLIS